MTRRVAVRSLVRHDRRQSAGWQAAPDQDLVATESPLIVRVQPPTGAPLSLGLFMRTPGDDHDLAVGALYAEGVIREISQVRQVRVVAKPADSEDADEVVVDVTGDADLAAIAGRGSAATSACGLCGRLEVLALNASSTLGAMSHSPLVSSGQLAQMPARLKAAQAAYAETGGLHAAGLFTPEAQLRMLREDVGRHNAVDKVAGALVREHAVPAAGHVLVVSGRIAYEIVQKAARCEIPVILAIGAPTDLAVDAARSAGITLAGFARDDRFNVYTRPDRVAPVD